MTPRLAFALLLSSVAPAFAGQVPGAANSPDIPISHHDRFYTSDQFSNTVSVIDPADNKLLGAIRLGDPTPGNLSPLYRGQLLVHGMGFSPDHRTLAVVSIGSNSVTFIGTATNAIKHITYVGRSPHEAFLPHGLWPSGDGTRIYVGLENADSAAAIDTLENEVIDTIGIGQAPQGVAYIPNAVPQGDGRQSLQPLGVAAERVQLTLAGKDPKSVTHVTLFDQGLVQVLQAAVTGLAPKRPFVLALSDDPKGVGRLEPLAGFMTNPAGAAIVNTIGPIRQVTQSTGATPKRYLVIVAGTPEHPGEPAGITAPW
jgi:YVTN family beta-propeller protein